MLIKLLLTDSTRKVLLSTLSDRHCSSLQVTKVNKTIQVPAPIHIHFKWLANNSSKGGFVETI